MPLHSIQRLSPDALLGLWHRTEVPADLWPLLPRPADYQPLLPPSAAPERQAQWLVGRVLVHRLLAELAPNPAADFILQNESTGRPWLAGEAPAPAVSLSHSGEWVAALLASSGRVGVDIELIRPKAQRLASKFLSAPDLQAAEAHAQTNPDPAAHFTLLWSAKETLYKLANQRGIIFKDQLLLHPSTLEYLPATLLLNDQATRHRVCYTEPAPGYVLTYCYEPDPIPEF